MAKQETAQAHKTTKTEETPVQNGTLYFFPNTGVGEPRTFEAASREDAEKLNQDYLDGVQGDE